jgi:hypothetical protein
MKLLKQDLNNLDSSLKLGSRDTPVGIATGYGLDAQGVVVRVSVGERFFSSPRRPDRFWGPPLPPPRGGGGNAAGVWSWPLTSNYFRGQEYVDLYIHFPIRLHGVVLN